MTISPNLLYIFKLLVLFIGAPLIIYFFYMLVKYILREISKENDLICYFILRGIYSLYAFWPNTYTRGLHKFYFIVFHSKIYKILFNFSPLWIIIHDCYYHNFVLSKIYPYLLFYVPYKP